MKKIDRKMVGFFPNKSAINAKLIGTTFALIANTFVWYFYAFSILRDVLSSIQMSSVEVLAAWCLNFSGAAFSAVLGAVIAEKLKKRLPFLLFWMLLGIASSFLPILIGTANSIAALILASVFGVSLGLGLPSCMGYFSECVSIENRAKIGGIIVFIFGLGAFLLGMAPATSIIERSFILSAWRISGLLIFLLVRNVETNSGKGQGGSYRLIFAQRSFLLYFVPWCMFCLINYSIIPITTRFFGEDFVQLSGVIESVLIGTFAIAGGFLADIFGRKRLSILGFVALGIGYGILGVFPESLLSWYFHITVDGIAWGIFYTMFLFTVWGDLSYGNRSEKYYAIGGLPFLLSNFLRFIVGSYVVQAIPIYAVFSLASFFLFLAVVPLMYAPETLPEKKIRDRELKTYVDKAREISEKYIRK